MQKIKHFLKSEQGKDILVVIVVVLVGLGSFELGRLSNSQNSGIAQTASVVDVLGSDTSQDATTVQPENYTQINNKTSVTSSVTAPAGKNFFASSRGKKYYSLTCSAGKSIKQENRVYFATTHDAEAAGYTLSSSCN